MAKVEIDAESAALFGCYYFNTVENMTQNSYKKVLNNILGIALNILLSLFWRDNFSNLKNDERTKLLVQRQGSLVLRLALPCIVPC